MIALLLAATLCQPFSITDSVRPKAADTISLLAHKWQITALNSPQSNEMQSVPGGKVIYIELHANGQIDFFSVEGAPKMTWRYDDGLVKVSEAESKRKEEDAMIITSLNSKSFSFFMITGGNKMKFSCRRADQR